MAHLKHFWKAKLVKKQIRDKRFTYVLCSELGKVWCGGPQQPSTQSWLEELTLETLHDATPTTVRSAGRSLHRSVVLQWDLRYALTIWTSRGCADEHGTPCFPNPTKTISSHTYFKCFNDLFIPKSECQKESLRSIPKSSF